MKKKTIALLLALALVFGGAVGGTIAWLTDKTETVTNTFTTAGIDITLTEMKAPDGGDLTGAWSAQLVPGKEYSKDPVVKVENTTDVDIYLFVKFEEKNAPSTYLTYTSTLTAANGWTQGDGTDIPADVWYRVVNTADATKSWKLLDGDKVTVNSNLTKDAMPAANATPELKYTAYASQLYKSAGVEFSAKEAWNNVPKA